MNMEISGFFPVPERAGAALGKLGEAGFDTSAASMVTGEDAKSALHSRLASAKRGRAAAGALIGGGLAMLVSTAFFLPALGSEGSQPWMVSLSLAALTAILAAAIGGFYGMGVEKNTILVGLLISRDRVAEAKHILHAAGARFLSVRAVKI